MPLSTDFSNKSAARGVLLRYNRDSHRFDSPLPPSPLDSCSVIRMGLALWEANGVWSSENRGENRVSRESNCSFDRLFCIRSSSSFFPFFSFASFLLFLFFVVRRGEGRFRGIGTSTITFQFRERFFPSPRWISTHRGRNCFSEFSRVYGIFLNGNKNCSRIPRSSTWNLYSMLDSVSYPIFLFSF